MSTRTCEVCGCALSEEQLNCPSCTPQTLSDRVAPSDQTIGHGEPPGYEILGVLGRGGMGVVYKARQVALGRVVALKMILGGVHAGPAELGRFQGEAVTIARLNHPHIVQLFEVGDHAGLPFLTLEFCPAGSLESALAGKPLPPREAAAMIEPLARALQAAHASGVIHRDLKPANVLLMADGTPKVTDFGLAKRVEAGALTQTGAVLGTPSYMAPEQAEGKKDVGPAADVYALGAILYECLTGRPPFRAATTYETMTQVMTADPVPITRLNPGVPRDLETVALKCLQKAPGRRYASAGDLADDLGRFLRDEPVRARPIGKLEAAGRLIRRHPGVAALLGSLAGLLVLIAVVASAVAWRFQKISQDAEWQRDRAEAAERDALAQLWESYRAQARAGRSTRQPGQRFDALDALAKAAAIRRTIDLRDDVIACLMLADIRPAATAPPAGDGLFGLTWTVEAGLVTGRRGEEVVARFGSKDDPARDYYLSPDGKAVAVTFRLVNDGPGRVEVWSLGPDVKRHSAPHQYAMAIGWADGGRLFFHTGPDGLTRVLDAATFAEARAIRLAAPRCQKWVLHPDGRRLLVGTWLSPGSQVIDLTTGREEMRQPTTGIPYSLAWHPSGRRFAVGKLTAGVHDFPSGRVIWQGGGNCHHGVAFTPDGSVLVTSGWSGFTSLHDANTGQPLVRYNGNSWGDIQAGNRIACGKATPSGFFEIADLSLCRPLAHQSFDFGHPGDFSPDGRLLALAGGKGVILLDTCTGLPLLYFACGPNESVRFAPDGSALYTYGNAVGLQRYPLIFDRDTFQVGTSSLLGVRYGRDQYSWLNVNPSGQLIASVWTENQVVILDPARPSGRRTLGIKGPRSVALSPDGKYAAVGIWHGNGMTVREVKTGKAVLEEKSELPTQVTFSPDGRWLVIARRDRHDVYRVGSWAAPHTTLPSSAENLPVQPSFSGDGKLLAIRDAPNRVRLLWAETLAEVAVLPARENGGINGLALDPEGRRLLVNGGGPTYVWDLEGVRDRLVEMELAFDWPAYPPRPRPGPTEGMKTDPYPPGEVGAQLREFARRMKELNPNFNENLNYQVADGAVTEMRFASDHVTDVSPLRFFSGLRTLDLSGTKAGVSRLEDLRPLKGMNLAGLKVLDLQYTRVTDSGLEGMQGCDGLTHLVLAGTRVTDAGLVTFEGCKRLNQLSLWNTRVTDAGLARFNGCSELTNLSLGGCRVGDGGLAHFAKATKLKSLSLYKTEVTDAGLAQLVPGKALTHVYLGDTKIGDATLALFKGSTSLVELSLYDTQVSDAGLKHLHGCKGLKILELSHLKLTASAIEALKAALPGCRITWDGGVIEPTK